MSSSVQDSVLVNEEPPSGSPSDSFNNKSREKVSQNSRINRFKVYRIRWFMLYLVVMCTVCMSMQFLQFSIIANIIVVYYGVSYEAVDWSAMAFLLFYIPTFFPVMHIMDKIGNRASILITICGTCLAAWIKVFSVAPDRYWVVALGQVVVSVSQGFVMVMPTRFSAAWFGENQVGLACGIAVFGMQLGTSIGCVIPTVLVKESKDKNAIAADLYVLNIVFAVFCTACFLATFAFFKSEPPTHPSGAQKQLEALGKVSFTESTKQLFKNYSYVLLFIAFGINIGIFYTIPTLLNQIILQYYAEGLEDAGRIGLAMMIIGMVGATSSGYILDNLQRYRLITILVFILYLLCMVGFSISLLHSIAAVYVSSIALGLCMSATYSIGLEVAAELTYPIPESASSGYLLGSAQVIGIILIYLYSFILHRFGAIWANIATCVELLISTLLIICMKFELRRKAAENLHASIIRDDGTT